MTDKTVLLRERFQLKETIVTITFQERSHLEAAKEEIAIQRALLEEFIRADPFFLVTLEPCDLRPAWPSDIIRQWPALSPDFQARPPEREYRAES